MRWYRFLSGKEYDDAWDETRQLAMKVYLFFALFFLLTVLFSRETHPILSGSFTVVEKILITLFYPMGLAAGWTSGAMAYRGLPVEIVWVPYPKLLDGRTVLGVICYAVVIPVTLFLSLLLLLPLFGYVPSW